jgi:hypothetical protein
MVCVMVASPSISCTILGLTFPARFHKILKSRWEVSRPNLPAYATSLPPAEVRVGTRTDHLTHLLGSWVNKSQGN